MGVRLVGKDERPPQVFNGKRLAQARELSGLSVEQLAEEMAVLSMLIILLENDAQQPDAALEAALSKRLDFPVGFFYREDPPEFGPSTLDWHIKKPKKGKV